MKEIADIVIIGGGIQGTSIAAHLAEAGVKDILLVEIEPKLGKGSTERSAAMIMSQVHSGDVRKAYFSKASIPEFENFSAKYGVDPNLVRCGSLLITTSDQGSKQLEEQAKHQISLGIPTNTLSESELNQEFPYLKADDIAKAIYCPSDGYLNQASIVQGYEKFAQRHGVLINRGTRALGIRLHKGRVQAVITERDIIHTENVINAAGGWADIVGAWVGLRIPIRRTLRSLWFCQPEFSPRKLPIIEDILSEWYIRPFDNQLMVGAGPIDEIIASLDSLGQYIKPSYENEANEFLAGRVPGLGKCRVSHGWAGVRALSPDGLPILGSTQVIGFFNACGWSGYGVMHAPVSGILMSEILLHGKALTLDVTPYALSRFGPQWGSL